LTDIETTNVDTLLSVSVKIARFKYSLSLFTAKIFKEQYSSNIYVKIISDKYDELFKQIEEEYQACRNINNIYTEIYNNIQAI